METTTCDALVAFRAALRGCFGGRGDALFEVVEGLLMGADAGAGRSRPWRACGLDRRRGRTKVFPCSWLFLFVPQAVRAMRSSHCLFTPKERHELPLPASGPCGAAV